MTRSYLLRPEDVESLQSILIHTQSLYQVEANKYHNLGLDDLAVRYENDAKECQYLFDALYLGGSATRHAEEVPAYTAEEWYEILKDYYHDPREEATA